MQLDATIGFGGLVNPEIKVYYTGILRSQGDIMGESDYAAQAKALTIAHEEILKAIDRANERIAKEITKDYSKHD